MKRAHIGNGLTLGAYQSFPSLPESTKRKHVEVTVIPKAKKKSTLNSGADVGWNLLGTILFNRGAQLKGAL